MSAPESVTDARLSSFRTPPDAVSVLTLFVVLLFIVPSQLIVRPLGASGTPANILGIACLGWWACARVVPGLGVDRRQQPVRVAVYVFAWAVLASYVAAQLRLITPIEARAADRGLLVLAGAAGVALLAADGVADRVRLDALLRRFVAAATALAAVGILQFSTGFDLAEHISLPGLSPNTDLSFIAQRHTFRRVAGTAIHAIEFGVVLAIVLPLAVHYAMTARPRRWWRWLPTLVIATAIPMSVSRSAVVALAAGGVVLFLGWNRRQRLAAAIISLVFAIGMRSLVPGLLGTIKGLFMYLFVDTSVTARTGDYAIVGPFLSDAPFFGRGFFTFLPEQYLILDNQYLLTLLETGLVGLTALLLLFLVAIGSARGARRRSSDVGTRSLAQALAASVVSAMMTFATFDHLSFPMAAGVVFLTIGCCGALWRLTATLYPRRSIPGS